MLYPYNYLNTRDTPYLLDYVYQGLAYTAFHEFGNVAGNTSVYLQITTGARTIHIFNHEIQIAGAGDVTASLYEGATVTTGTILPDLPPKSFDRRIGESSSALTSIFTNPSSINLGSATMFMREKIYNNGGGFGGKDSRVSGIETVLAPNATYLLQLTNTSNNTLDMTVGLKFYESDN
ncbi:hypothetical protein CN899_08040 [Bacillus thuringiensis]|uniref:Uncharacterized protein n=1 Tax=Bacillus thuringiensis TaxID=1428 RepID=A0A9X7C268_BACTU|nr:hypothetical protein [Bacillus thuringiensis]PGH85781.1 hypothetical protein CN899_08040 [Bacillus thuringiensis]